MFTRHKQIIPYEICVQISFPLHHLTIECHKGTVIVGVVFDT